METWSSVSPAAFPSWGKSLRKNKLHLLHPVTYSQGEPFATCLGLLRHRDMILGSLDGDGPVFCWQFLPPLLLLLPAHWEMQHLQGIYSVAGVGVSEVFPEVEFEWNHSFWSSCWRVTETIQSP